MLGRDLKHERLTQITGAESRETPKRPAGTHKEKPQSMVGKVAEGRRDTFRCSQCRPSQALVCFWRMYPSSLNLIDTSSRLQRLL